IPSSTTAGSSGSNDGISNIGYDRDTGYFHKKIIFSVIFIKLYAFSYFNKYLDITVFMIGQ
ncbi:6521_t:CDS:1, partial [Rhizophagus irregularis]